MHLLDTDRLPETLSSPLGRLSHFGNPDAPEEAPSLAALAREACLLVSA